MTNDLLNLIHAMILAILEHEKVEGNVAKLRQVLATIEEVLFEES